MISFNVRGSSNKTEKFLTSMSRLNIVALIDPIARDGLRALREATPKDSGLTAESWDYVISKTRHGVTITWTNTSDNGFPVAVMLQYGYGTGTGGYVQGRDYINPAIKPTFDAIAERVWKVVSSA